MNDIDAALKQARQQLENTLPDARLEAEILLAHTLNKNRAYLYAHPKTNLTQVQQTTYDNLILKRSKGTPIAYLTEYREFWSLKLKVSPATLIPRHETERLVELALDLIPNNPNTHILDLGTGSGAIAIAIAHERPLWRIDAIDSSLDALNIAKLNAKNHHLTNINFFHSNWFEQVPAQRYHAIVSNPPYIEEEDPHLAQGDLQFEPRHALVSGKNGLADLQYIIEHSKKFLIPDGLLLLEHGYNQKTHVISMLNHLEYKKVHCWQDLQGHDRVSGGNCS